MFMGDRWSFPHQASAATYVWMPMQADKGKLSIPEYWQAWDIKTLSTAHCRSCEIIIIILFPTCLI